jgi:RHS repeat-associated protein
MIAFHKIQHALLWLVLACFLSITTAQAGSLTFTYYATDALGSPVVAMNQAGDVIWRKTYEPYGKASGADGDNRVGYTGHVEEQNGLVYAGARYYDPALGRFLSDDPVRFTESNPMSFNRYAYANNNPYKYVDPDGRAAAFPLLVMAVGTIVATNNAQAPTSTEDMHPNMDVQTIDTVSIIGGVGALTKIGFTGFTKLAEKSAGEKFFEGATLHPRVLSQFEKGDNHAFPELVDTLAKKYGAVSKTVDSRGGAVDMLKLEGSRNGVEGTYEYVKNSAGEIFHRFFNPAE